MKDYKKSITIIFFILILAGILVIAGDTENYCSTDPDYIYWPSKADSIAVYLKNINEYYNKVEYTTLMVDKIKKKHTDDWRVYYQIYLNYESLEKLSINQHPRRVKYYSELKKVYEDVYLTVRRAKLKERVIKHKYKLD